jgi:hypothetical protein
MSDMCNTPQSKNPEKCLRICLSGDPVVFSLFGNLVAYIPLEYFRASIFNCDVSPRFVNATCGRLISIVAYLLSTIKLCNGFKINEWKVLATIVGSSLQAGQKSDAALTFLRVFLLFKLFLFRTYWPTFYLFSAFSCIEVIKSYPLYTKYLLIPPNTS